jgi:hypothetical protein
MHHSNKKCSAFLFAFICITVVLAFTTGVQPIQAEEDTCLNCHSDQEWLKEYTVNWSKVYVDPTQMAEEAHGGLDCVTCHTGDPTKDTPEEACIGIAYKDPAAPETVRKTCGSCHPEITDRHLSSIHSTLNGIRLSLHDLVGEEEGEARFQASCNKCHTTCSSCHMEQPGAHGLLQPQVESHSFAAESSTDVCVACHDGTGVSYLGNPKVEGAVPSSMAEAGIECMGCHVEEDVHGTGVRTNFLSETEKPKCETCHKDPGYLVSVSEGQRLAPQFDEENPAHADHKNSLSCVACHTQWYQSCWNCHAGREERSTTDVYLAVNPLTNLVHPAVHSPATSPDWGDIPAEIGGGWAIKSRHSWGESLTCEYCHTDAAVYITGKDRQAPFVGVWGEGRAQAAFVDETAIQQILIDAEALAAGVHKDTGCLDCHSTTDDAVCSECHANVEKSGLTLLADETDWSRTGYATTRDNLREIETILIELEARGIQTGDWSEQWSSINEDYLQGSKTFHDKPGETQKAMDEIAGRSENLIAEVDRAMEKDNARRDWLLAGIPFGLGVIGAVVLGYVVEKPNRKDEVNHKCEETE